MKLRGEQEKVTIYMSPERHRALKVEAARRGLSMSDVVDEALQLRGQNVVKFTDHDGAKVAVKYGG